MKIREFVPEDLEEMRSIWNQVVEAADAFPQEKDLEAEEAYDFFKNQAFTGVAEEDGKIAGLYILHPNNVGRCGHISNASYAVRQDMRGQQIGEKLVRHSIQKAEELGFGILQFNAVVASNHAAVHLYEKIGFAKLGTIPKGFRTRDGTGIRILFCIIYR